jgi:hypothetical protein
MYNELLTKAWAVEKIRNIYTHLIGNLKGNLHVAGKIVLLLSCVLVTIDGVWIGE